MAQVLGLGGVFFKSADPARLGNWYREHLGVPFKASQGAVFNTQAMPADAQLVWTPFSADTNYFAPSMQAFMINFIVDDVDAVIERAVAGGATQVGEVADYPYGRFGWLLDPEGNKIELWAPAAE